MSRDITDLMPFAAVLGVELGETSLEGTEGTLTWSPAMCTTGGIMHGGALMGLADTLGGICAFANLPTGARTSTIESKTNFMRGIHAGVVTGRSVPLHVGRTTIVVRTEVRDADGRLAAFTVQTQAVIEQ